MKISGLVSVLAFLCAAITQAAEPAKPAAAVKPAQEQQQEPASRVYFIRMDKNGDQKLQLPEFESEVELQFLVMDADKDGYVSKAEYVQYFCGNPKNKKDDGKARQGALGYGECVAVRTAKYDTVEAKKDGKLSKEEAKAATRMDFKSADTDKNGVLTITEWEGLFSMYQGKGCDCEAGKPCPCKDKALKLAPTDRATGKAAEAAKKEAIKKAASKKCEKPCSCKNAGGKKDAEAVPAPAQTGVCGAAQACECPKPNAPLEAPRIPAESMRP